MENLACIRKGERHLSGLKRTIGFSAAAHGWLPGLWEPQRAGETVTTWRTADGRRSEGASTREQKQRQEGQLTVQGGLGVGDSFGITMTGQLILPRSLAG